MMDQFLPPNPNVHPNLKGNIRSSLPTAPRPVAASSAPSAAPSSSSLQNAPAPAQSAGAGAWWPWLLVWLLAVAALVYLLRQAVDGRNNGDGEKGDDAADDHDDNGLQ